MANGRSGAVAVIQRFGGALNLNGRLRLLALIEQARTVERILRHLGLPTDLPELRSARAPPLPADGAAASPDRSGDATG